MHGGQSQFYQYILENVKEDKKEVASTLLKESFNKQDQGTFNDQYLQQFIIKITDILKEDRKEEVLSIMKNFRNKKG